MRSAKARLPRCRYPWRSSQKRGIYCSCCWASPASNTVNGPIIEPSTFKASPPSPKPSSSAISTYVTASIIPEPPNSSGNGVVSPVWASFCISSGAISPRFSAARPCTRNCSTAKLWAKSCISFCSSVGAKSSITLYPFNNHCICCPSTLTDRLQAILFSSALQLIEQHRRQTRPGGSQGMSNRYCATIHIHPAHISSRFLLPRQHHARKRLIDFHQIDLIQRQPCLF